jgi:predicted enzyme related to lactoylglutathione lyase
MSDAARPSIHPDEIVVDTDDPERLGAFYAELLGWEVRDGSAEWVTIRGASDPVIAFQMAVNYVPPTWPVGSVPQQIHLDFAVTDLAAATAFAVSLGARLVATTRRPGDNFNVLLDPSGHPFCLCSGATAPPGEAVDEKADTERFSASTVTS